MPNCSAIVEQKGFEHVEIEAMRQFGEYYGIHLNFDYLLHQEYRNPLYLKMLCEVAQTQENFHAEAADLMKLMKDFFVVFELIQASRLSFVAFPESYIFFELFHSL